MASKKSANRSWRYVIQLELLIVGLILPSEASTVTSPGSDNGSATNDGMWIDKRYLAALAKNGRLPKFAAMSKRENLDDKISDEESSDTNAVDDMWVDEKRHIGAFLKSHGKPTFGGMAERRSTLDDVNYVEAPVFQDEMAGKRNVATLARLGGLNALRYGQFQPQYYSGKKRIQYNQEPNDASSFKENNEVSLADDDCEPEKKEKETNNEDNNVYPNWFQNQEKRYVAALARSGRLPIWHSQGMWWGGKRDIPNAYFLRYRSGARAYKDLGKSPSDTARYLKLKEKRCKKSQYDNKRFKEPKDEKRNLAMLARNGVLVNRPNSSR